MDVTTKCPKCGLMLALDTSQAEEFECPQCGQRLTVQTGARKAKPLKRGPPPAGQRPPPTHMTPTPHPLSQRPTSRTSASYGPPPESQTDDIDWSIPEIPQSYQRRKRRRVDLDPAVVWSILIVAACVVALIVGGVIFSQRGMTRLTAGEGRATMLGYVPDDWDVQAFLNVGALTRNPHRNSLLLLGTKPVAATVTRLDDVDELLISDGAARCLVATTLVPAPTNDDLKRTGGVVETYQGFDVFRKDGRPICRLSDKALAVADNDAAMRRIIDAGRATNRMPPDLPLEYSAFYRVRTRALRVRTTLPDWTAPFDALGVSVLMQKDGGATLFLFGEAPTEAHAREALPAIERLRANFREQLATLRTLYRGTLNDLEKLSSALAVNQAVQEGKRVGVRCVLTPELFLALFQPQLGSFASAAPTTPPTTVVAATPNQGPPVRDPSMPPAIYQPQAPDPGKGKLPAFEGPAADQIQQAQNDLAARYGRGRTVMVVGIGFNGLDAERLTDGLLDLVKKMYTETDSLNYHRLSANGWVACVFAPIEDLDGVARRIEFAEVAQISSEQRRIYLTPKK